MIQSLNMILLTAAELHEVRATLKNLISSKSDKSKQLFITLYKSWAHSPAATFSLCLLSQLYELSSALIFKLYVLISPILTPRSADIEVSVNLLVEVDKLVQLLESPIFLCTSFIYLG